MVIRNVEFVNARTKVAHCKINNLGIDVTVNQTSSLSSAAFLEEIDRLIGFNHLFKRSLILIKVCSNFSHSLKFCNYFPKLMILGVVCS